MELFIRDQQPSSEEAFNPGWHYASLDIALQARDEFGNQRGSWNFLMLVFTLMMIGA